ncbi:acetyl-CoA carboxylase biotin carboxyl carrier protein [Alkalihalobacillus oceani]|uniref:acetyl-CoA carboxylase biotin carboxyl carrier protein n=1 Tax=Halalkalibacter oceani TaxID=1653776 RepID=UPI0020401D63|nr:acetyl-CoA carboxylase biotin carboxyl carrier protein [Halalkalibacter oceani]MCM3762750.1 acetyl-CoA carboxylase biotin carboxyl carrier protein [Halalkalibacter oceani]
MLKVQEIKELIRALDQSDLDELKFEQDGTKLVLKKQQAVPVQVHAPAAAPAPAAVSQPPVKQVESEVSATPAPTTEKAAVSESKANDDKLHTITSPMVGTFYAAPSPDADPYVATGDQVKEESVVCIVEAMKLMNEIEAEVNGKIVDILAENGELVEYGQPLFVVELS